MYKLNNDIHISPITHFIQYHQINWKEPNESMSSERNQKTNVKISMHIKNTLRRPLKQVGKCCSVIPVIGQPDNNEKDEYLLL